MVDYDSKPPSKAETYRDALALYPLVIDEIKPLHPGPRDTCPGCGTCRSGKYNTAGNYVTDGVSGSKSCNFLRRWFGGCREKRRHLHQSCGNCRAKWAVGYHDDKFA